MPHSDPFKESKLQHLQLFIYLIPIFGFFPALWTLYRHQGSREQQKVSRLVVTLAVVWLLGYSLLAMEAGQTSELLSLRVSLINALFTSGYFLVCLGLMARLWQRKSTRLPVLSQIAEGVVRKNLSS